MDKKKVFYEFVLELKLSRKRKKENLEINSLEKAERNFNELMKQIILFDDKIQKRLRMIKKHWMKNTVVFEGTNRTILDFIQILFTFSY